MSKRTEMPEGAAAREKEDPERLLTAAAKMIASVRYCWLLTHAEGSVRARPMGRILPDSVDDRWTIRFATDRRSRKAAEVRRSGTVSIAFQNEHEDAFVNVTGSARLIENAPEVRALWKEDAYAAYFPTREDRENVGFIEVRTMRIELWMRGVTPEPFGLRATILERDPQGNWTHVA